MSATRMSVKSLSSLCLFAFALVLVSCTKKDDPTPPAPTYTVGGTVSGLAGSVTLQNNGGDNRTVSADGPFTFATALANAATYNVAVLTQPAGQFCSVSNGSGAISGANVSNVAVACVNTYTVGGNVTGLAGTGLKLRNNNNIAGDEITVLGTGTVPFTFTTPILSGAAYSVTVFAQPTSPSQTCTVSNGSGTVGSANVTNVAVACVNNIFHVIDSNSGVGVPGVDAYLDAMLDQTSLVTITNAIDTSFQPGFGQSFAAGITGTLAQVWIVGFGTGPSQPVTMRFCNGAGPCAAPTFVVLPMDQGSYTPDPGSGFRWKELDVSLQNFQVTAGQQYSFQFTNNTNANYQNCGGGYAGGQVFNSQCSGTGDLAFQTFVLPPPLGTTDAAGNMPFSLTGVHSVHFHKAGHYVNSRVNRDWTAVSGTVTILTRPYPGGTTTGTVSGTISNTAAGDGNIRVISRRSSDGLSSFSFPLAADLSTPYSLAALIGTSDLFVVPNGTSFPAASSFVGYSPGVAAPSTVNPTLVRSAATSFAVTGAGGFAAPGSIFASYGVTTNRSSLGLDLFTLSSASTSGATLGATVNVPPVNLVYPSAMYKLNVRAFSIPSTFGGPTGANYQARDETRVFPTYADMVAAAASPQNIVLTDDALIAISPAHNAVNVPVSPTFTWSRVGSPDYVVVALFEYDPVRLIYNKVVWTATVYGNAFSVTPPATVTLNPNSFYQYDLLARRDLFDGAGALVGWQRNGWEDVKFSTGATTPP